MHHRTRYSSVGQDDLHRTPLRGQNQGCVSTTSFSTWWCLTKGYSISTILSRLFSCHGKESCSMHCGSGPMNGGDPCGGIYKYAKIIYKCAGKGSGHAINCGAVAFSNNTSSGGTPPNCTAPTFFAYDGGNSCCETNTCGATCCHGDSARCVDSDGITPKSNCQDAGDH